MDATQIIILTSLINIILDGVIVGVVIYTIQKKIDDTLQRSQFEYQTKFVSTHTKRIETLQTLYKKLAGYSEHFGDMIDQVGYFCNSKLEKVHITQSDYEKIGEQLEDFRIYFVESRLFLTEEIVDKIKEIVNGTKILYEEIYSVLPFRLKEYREDQYGEDFDPFRATLIGLLDYDRFRQYSSGNLEGFDYADMLGIMDSYMFAQVRELDDIYKSVAGDKHIK